MLAKVNIASVFFHTLLLYDLCRLSIELIYALSKAVQVALNVHAISDVPRVYSAEDKVSLGTPTQPFSGNIEAKNELGVKGRRKMTRNPHIFLYRPVSKLHMTVTSQNWRQDFEAWKSLTLPIPI